MKSQPLPLRQFSTILLGFSDSGGGTLLLFLVMRLLLVVSVSLALGLNFQAKQVKPDIKLTGFLGTFNNFVRVPLGNA
jgi:hypothetical protein